MVVSSNDAVLRAPSADTQDSAISSSSVTRRTSDGVTRPVAAMLSSWSASSCRRIAMTKDSNALNASICRAHRDSSVHQRKHPRHDCQEVGCVNRAGPHCTHPTPLCVVLVCEPLCCAAHPSNVVICKPGVTANDDGILVTCGPDPDPGPAHTGAPSSSVARSASAGANNTCITVREQFLLCLAYTHRDRTHLSLGPLQRLRAFHQHQGGM